MISPKIFSILQIVQIFFLQYEKSRKRVGTLKGQEYCHIFYSIGKTQKVYINKVWKPISFEFYEPIGATYYTGCESNE